MSTLWVPREVLGDIILPTPLAPDELAVSPLFEIVFASLGAYFSPGLLLVFYTFGVSVATFC